MKTLAYSMRRSPRARYPGLKYSRREGLEVIVPRGMRFSRADAEKLLSENRAWIERCRRKLSQIPLPERTRLPETVESPALDRTWRLEKRAEKGKRSVRLEVGEGVLLFRGALDRTDLALEVLRRFLKETTRREIGPRLARLARETGLTYERVSVRGQKTRWASCSTKGTISLNYKLLFLPPELVDYVLLHELCHTAHMNHSREFWKLVERFSPAYREREKELRRAAALLPAWTLD